MAPDPRRRNRITGLVLAVIVIGIFVWTVLRGSKLMG